MRTEVVWVVESQRKEKNWSKGSQGRCRHDAHLLSHLWPLPSSVLPQAGPDGLALPLSCPEQVELVEKVHVKHL